MLLNESHHQTDDGLPMAQLQSVFDAIVLSRILYAATAWRGYLSAGEMARIQQLFVKAKRWNIVILMYYWRIVIEHFSDHLCI